MAHDRVGLMIGTNGAYARLVVAGIRRFVEETGRHWAFAMTPHEQPDLETLISWHPRGIIAHFWTHASARKLVALRIPIINVGTRLPSPSVPHVGNDDEAVGQSGARHFLERQFRRFAYVGWQGLGFSLLRKAGYRAALAEAGFGCEIYEDEPGSWVRRVTNSVSHHKQLCVWLARLEAPMAIMACNDVRASHVLRACAEIGRAVPEEIAVLGVDNDEVWCSLANPPLSSVAVAAERIGYLAALELARAFTGGKPPLDIALPPLNVVVRKSTDSLAIGKPVLAEAIRYIREHADRPVTIAEVLKAVSLTRRTLERLFRKNLGCSVAQEIRLTHLRRAQDLVATSELPMEEIARLSGFTGYKHMWNAFRKTMQLTPVEYRERLRRVDHAAG